MIRRSGALLLLALSVAPAAAQSPWTGAAQVYERKQQFVAALRDLSIALTGRFGDEGGRLPRSCGRARDEAPCLGRSHRGSRERPPRRRPGRRRADGARHRAPRSLPPAGRRTRLRGGREARAAPRRHPPVLGDGARAGGPPRSRHGRAAPGRGAGARRRRHTLRARALRDGNSGAGSGAPQRVPGCRPEAAERRGPWRRSVYAPGPGAPVGGCVADLSASRLRRRLRAAAERPLRGRDRGLP